MRSLTKAAFLVVLLVGAGAATSAPALGAPSPVPYGWGSFKTGPGGVVATPTAIGGVPGTIVQLDAANSATYALTKSGTVWAWGFNGQGQLGDGTTSHGTSTTPVQVEFPASVTVSSLPSPMPAGTAMAIDSHGNAWGWGSNSAGQLCLGNTTQEDKPVELPFAGVTAATGAGDHASYVSNGHLFSCGGNRDGELGDGNTGASLIPVPVSLSNVVSVYSSWSNTAALLSDGEFWIWGLNNLGQLGNGTRVNSDSPVEVELRSPVTQASVGGNTRGDGQTIVQLADGTVRGWGADRYGQLCDGRQRRARKTPETLHLSVALASFASSGNTSYLLDTSGNVWACGDNRKGEIGNGQEGGPVLVPTEVLSGVTTISGTSYNVAALR